jgi:hypothetical protein
LGADAPKPPLKPGSSAEEVIQAFQEWGSVAGISTSVVPRERKALIEFFEDNPKTTSRELIAMMLGAWSMPDTTDPETGYQKFWHCINKGWRIKSFLEFLPSIQEEIGWKGNETQISAVMKTTHKQFKMDGRKL